MFMRVGGGIFTKAADVGADLVGKVEQGIPEDDPRNAATIADNVGDNVGDCAGMAADLFESYAVTLVAALILGSQAFGDKGLVFPLLIPAIGALTARPRVSTSPSPRPGENGLTTINRVVLHLRRASPPCSASIARLRLPAEQLRRVHQHRPADLAGARRRPALHRRRPPSSSASCWPPSSCALTGYYTGTEHRPVKDVGTTSLTGAATVILSGLSVGFESAVYTALVIGARRLRRLPARWRRAHRCRCSPSRSPAAACSPPSASSSRWTPSVRSPTTPRASPRCRATSSGEGAQILTELDAVGNTTKAITKGIAIATAVLAATALFGSYTDARCFESLARGQRRRRRGLPARLQRLQPGRHSSACCSARPWCSSSPASRSTRSPAPPARSSSRCAASSARSPGSWRAPAAGVRQGRRHRAPRTRCASWSRPGLLAVLAPDRGRLRPRRRRRSPASWPAPSAPAP